MFVYDYEVNSEDVEYLLENEDELEDFLTSNLTVDEATELKVWIKWI